MNVEPPVTTANAAAFDALLDSDRRARRGAMLALLVIVVVILTAFAFVGFFDAQRFAEAVPALLKIASEMVPPDFARWRAWVMPLIDTLAMSVAGTAMAVALSLPLALGASRATSPNAGIYRASRFALNVLRAIPELIMGILLVAAVGFGALPGVLALGLHSVGMIGKFFAEAIEHADPRPVEAARAAGATDLQVIARAILPQVLPQMADTAIYRWEYNFRASTVMGAVGAGGIGTQLMGSLRIMDYPQVLAILLVILGCVTVVDGVGGALRRRLA